MSMPDTGAGESYIDWCTDKRRQRLSQEAYDSRVEDRITTSLPPACGRLTAAGTRWQPRLAVTELNDRRRDDDAS